MQTLARREPARVQRSREAGVTALETIGLMILAAVVVVAIAVTLGNNDLGVHVKRAVCQIITLGQGDCDFPTADERIPTEPCVVGETGWSGSLQVSAGITGERNATVKTEQLANGQYRVTVTSGSAIGVEGGFGGGISINVDGQEVGGEASAGAEASANFSKSEVYVVNSKGEAEKIEQWAIYQQVRDTVIPDVPLLGWLLEKAADQTAEWLGLTPPPAPTATTYSGGTSAEASAEITAGVGGAQGTAGFGSVIGVQKNKDGGETVVWEVNGTASIGASPNDPTDAPVAAGGTWRLIAEDTYDSSGKRTGMVLKRVHESKNDVTTVESYYVPIDSPEDDKMATEMMDNPAKIDDFYAYAKENGQVSRVEYNTSKGHEFGFDMSGEFIAKVGVSLEGASINSSVQKAQYWNGTDWVDWESCPVK